MKDHRYYVYILASRRNGTLYTGVTNDFLRRVQEHKRDATPGFTSRYGVHMLVYYEIHGDIQRAIQREKRVKRWNRAWKIQLIERENPRWHDLYASLVEDNTRGQIWENRRIVGSEDDYEERAAIMEYDGGLSRRYAEHRARKAYSI